MVGHFGARTAASVFQNPRADGLAGEFTDLFSQHHDLL
jgi:hypothetical protein